MYAIRSYYDLAQIVAVTGEGDVVGDPLHLGRRLQFGQVGAMPGIGLADHDTVDVRMAGLERADQRDEVSYNFV